jgi:Icc-related predicted phosphoesterase
MKINYASDLHLEVCEKYSPDLLIEKFKGISGDVLILAGDIHVNKQFNIPTLLMEAKVGLDFEHLIFVPGNHEFYNGDIVKNNDNWSDIVELSIFDNIHILNPGQVKIDGVNFIGATLWTDYDDENPFVMMNARKGMTDFRLIKYDGDMLTPEFVLDEFLDELNYLTVALTDADERVEKSVVITHHAPSYQSVSSEFKNDSLNGCFVSDLEEFIFSFSNLTHWIHGHVHSNHNYTVGDTNVLCNSYGYSALENTEFKIDSHFEIEAY